MENDDFIRIIGEKVLNGNTLRLNKQSKKYNSRSK